MGLKLRVKSDWVAMDLCVDGLLSDGLLLSLQRHSRLLVAPLPRVDETASLSSSDSSSTTTGSDWACEAREAEAMSLTVMLRRKVCFAERERERAWR